MLPRPILIFPLVAILSVGCSTFVPLGQEVTIIASTPGAEVYINNEPVGESPVTVNLARNDSYAITSSADPAPYEDNRRISVTGVLDIVGACIWGVPLIGCFTPGFWSVDTDVHLKDAPHDYGVEGDRPIDTPPP